MREEQGACQLFSLGWLGIFPKVTDDLICRASLEISALKGLPRGTETGKDNPGSIVKVCMKEIYSVCMTSDSSAFSC